MKNLKALKPHVYDDIRRQTGDTYRASNQHANLLVITGNAAYYEKPEPKPKRTYTRRNMAANKPAGYNTKDQSAE